jgi:hypothetical protein
VLGAFRLFARAGRAIDPGRPITTGNSAPRPHAEHLRQRLSGVDTPDDYRKNLLDVNPGPYDLVSIHLYPQHAERRFGAEETPLSELLALTVDACRPAGKAVFLGEFGVSQQALEGDSPRIRELFQNTLRDIVQSQTDLAAVWVFNYGHQDTTWNVTADNQRAWMLDAIADANRQP